MTKGEQVIQAGLKYEGWRETPPNGGEPLVSWQEEAARELGLPENTYHGAPWCAIFCRTAYREAGVEIHSRLVHPYTGYICQQADEMGGLAPNGPAPSGSLVVWCSVHVGLVVRDRGNGLIDTLEGNSNDMVRRGLRDKAGCRIIVPPGIEEGSPSGFAKRPSYGFDDLRIKPKTFGPWQSAAGRDRMMNNYREANPEQWVAPVSMERSGQVRFAFRAGLPGTYGEKWQFGGWPTKETRDKQMAAYGKKVGHNNLRTWRRVVPAPIALGGSSVTEVDRDSKTT